MPCSRWVWGSARVANLGKIFIIFVHSRTTVDSENGASLFRSIACSYYDYAIYLFFVYFAVMYAITQDQKFENHPPSFFVPFHEKGTKNFYE
jgi:hypothetical protein